MTIGKRIKEKRLERKMSLDDLAKAASVKRQTIYKYENGIITDIPMKRVTAIANALCVDVPYLMGWDITQEIDENGNICKSVNSESVIVEINTPKFRISLNEIMNMIEELDDYGIDLVTTVVEKEFERCSALREKDLNE